MAAIAAQITLRFPPDLLNRIDARRGDTSRNAWIIRRLEEVLDEQDNPTLNRTRSRRTQARSLMS